LLKTVQKLKAGLFALVYKEGESNKKQLIKRIKEIFHSNLTIFSDTEEEDKIK